MPSQKPEPSASPTWDAMNGHGSAHEGSQHSNEDIDILFGDDSPESSPGAPASAPRNRDNMVATKNSVLSNDAATSSKSQTYRQTARKSTGGKPPKGYLSRHGLKGKAGLEPSRSSRSETTLEVLVTRKKPQLVETPPSTGTSSSSQEALIQAESSDDEDITEAKRLLQELQRQKVEAKEGRKKRELEAAAARKMQEELNRVAEINRLERERKATEEQLMRLTREEQDLVDAVAARTVKVKTRPQPELEGRSDSFPRSDRVKKVAPGVRTVPWGPNNSCAFCEDIGKNCVPAKNEDSKKCELCDRKTLECGPWKLARRSIKIDGHEATSDDYDDDDDTEESETEESPSASGEPWGPSNPCPECIREGTKCEAQTPLKIANFKKPGALRPCSRCARKRIKCGTYAGRKSSRKGKNREGGGKEKAAKSRPESLPINQNSDQGACIIDLLQQILKEMKGRKRSRDTTEGFFFKDSDDDVEKPRKRKKI
ncbi:hypothetical protein BJ165DRAFT_1528860 [Panaeolus papilionaceus]|nr:hypothetical protein BJ165DRAFT_1528860 [Panaeolus papilionaceus]